MRKIISYDTAKTIDTISQEQYNIPSLVLMEHAGNACVDVLLPRLKEKSSIYIMCGSGNNGGDAGVIARLLLYKNYRVTVCYVSEPKTNSAKIQNRILNALACPIIEPTDLYKTLLNLQSHDWIVDGITGIGLSTPYKNSTLIDVINESAAQVLAIDVPTGLLENSIDGTIGSTIKATVTATMGLEKSPMYYPQYREYCGEIIVINPGFPPQGLEDAPAVAMMLEASDIHALLPPLPKDCYKHCRGIVAICAGSKESAGAAYLALLSALQSTAGLVYGVLDEELRQYAAMVCPPAITGISLQDIDKLHAIVVGPGWGRNRAIKQLHDILERALPTVLDADALHILKQSKMHRLVDPCPPLIFTPHKGELAMLYPRLQIDNNTWAAADAVATEYEATVVAKNSVTYIASSGQIPYVIDGREKLLATAGSGDVLAGIMGSIIAYYIASYQQQQYQSESQSIPQELFHTAAAVSALIHACAGNKLAQLQGSGDAMDIIRTISSVIHL